MRETFYEIGFILARAVPLFIGLYCLKVIIRNVSEITRIKEEQAKNQDNKDH